MKKVLLTLLFAATAAGAAAQRTPEQMDSVKRTAPARREAVRADLWAMPRSEVRLGVGFSPMLYAVGGRKMDSTVPGIKQDQTLTTPLFSVGYTYRVVGFLEVGASVGYGYQSKHYTWTDGSQRSSWSELHQFSVSVFVRYAWANSRWVSAYSSLGLFTAFEYSPNTWPSEWRFVNTHYPVLPDVTLIGVRVGRRLFGYIEPFCFNGRGFVIQGGVGYKF